MTSMKFGGISKFACLAAVCVALFALDLIRAQNAEAPPSLIEPPSSSAPESSTDATASPAPQTSTDSQTSTDTQTPAASRSSTETRSATVQKTETTGEDFGIGRFSKLPVNISASVQGGYDDNVLTSNSAHGSLFTAGNLTLAYQFGSPRTHLTLSTGGGLTYYFDRPGSSQFDENAFLDLAVTHKATPRLTLAANLHISYQVEPDFNYNVGPNRRTGNYFYTDDKFSVTYLWAPRFSTLTSYSPGIVRYDKSTVASFEDRFENTFGNELRFLAWPTTTLVAEYRYEVINYDSSLRDSNTHFALAGFDHNFNPRTLLTFRGGEEFRTSDFGGDHNDPYFEGGLTYKVGHNSITFTNRYSIEEPDIPTVAIQNTFRTGLLGTYDLTPRISSSFGFYYQHADNQAFTSGGIVSPDFLEQTVDLSLTLRYSITHVLGIQAGYSHTQVISDLAGRDYSRNRYFGGLNLAF